MFADFFIVSVRYVVVIALRLQLCDAEFVGLDCAIGRINCQGVNLQDWNQTDRLQEWNLQDWTSIGLCKMNIFTEMHKNTQK